MRILTGIQPSGDFHLGNYFGAIKPILDLQKDNELFVFIANYHALTSVQSKELLQANIKKAVASFLSLGLDHEKSVFYLQSDVKEVLELYWILSQFCPIGLLERAHSYKDKISKGLNATHGLFSYPVLMAADILLFDAEIIPVGKDQIQHLEIARDLALKFNNLYDKSFVLPEAKITQNLVPGTDGEKMSKSYKNTIDIFSTKLKKQINSIQTDSTPLNEPKDFSSCKVFKIASLFLNQEEEKQLKDMYETPGKGYGDFKKYLYDLVCKYFKASKEKYEYYLAHEDVLQDILEQGKQKASKIAKEKMKTLYEKIGL